MSHFIPRFKELNRNYRINLKRFQCCKHSLIKKQVNLLRMLLTYKMIFYNLIKFYNARASYNHKRSQINKGISKIFLLWFHNPFFLIKELQMNLNIIIVIIVIITQNKISITIKCYIIEYQDNNK